MLVVMAQGAAEAQIQKVIDRLVEEGFDVHRSTGAIHTLLGGVGGNWHVVGLGNIGHSNSKANVAITARIIDTDTGEILGVADGKGIQQNGVDDGENGGV